MKGEYLKNCNCIASCPCDTEGVPFPGPGCEGVVAMRVAEGNFDGVSLDGVTWAVAVYWPGALHEGNGSAQPYIDASTSAEQRDALLKILSGQAGGTLFEILSAIITTVHEPQFVPIELDLDRAGRRASLRVPGFIETETEPLTIPATDQAQRVVVRMPAGFEYKEMEVARCKTLKGTGAIKLDHKNTHSSLALVEHTDQGLVA